MNLCWFKEAILEELEGAKEYAEHAIEIRAMKPEWQSKLLEISAAELSHAEYLYSMLQEYYKTVTAKYTEIPENMSDIYECISKKYMECYNHVRWLHELAKK